MKQRFHGGGLAAWSIQHPIGVIMLTLTVVVIGLFSLQRLSIDLLPHIIYPDIRVRVLDPGVPAEIMEDKITRQLEEQLAITEGAIQVQSTTREGRSAVDLSFPYGTDIDQALRDASTRLDRAKRFLPTTIEPPIIYKPDPSQLPVMELVLSSYEMNAAELRSWADYTFAKWFINLPGVASVEVGGGVEREIQVIPDQEKLASLGLTLNALAQIIRDNNADAAGGRLVNAEQEISIRTRGRLRTIDELRQLAILPAGQSDISAAVQLRDIAEIRDGHADERLRVRLNTLPGIKISIQKLPQANTVAVASEVEHRLANLQQQGLIPDSVQIEKVGDQSVFVRYAINNAASAAITGALLAMLVVYLFLGDLKRTLIIGAAIPIGILVTFTIMDAAGLTLNIMTLGGLALGLGLLIDSTIVMLENITRHQHDSGSSADNAVLAASEVNSPIVASTGTNLAAILPFLFIGGLTGLLFQELIITISSAMLAALVVALTLAPALGANLKLKDAEESKPIINNNLLNILKVRYQSVVRRVLRRPWLWIGGFSLLLAAAVVTLSNSKTTFLPDMDEGNVSMSIKGEVGVNLDEMDATVEKIENLLLQQPEVEAVFSTVGGFIFGRSTFERSNHSSLRIQLRPESLRDLDSRRWVAQMRKKIEAMQLAGFKVSMWVRGVRGLRLGSGDNELSLRIQGDELETLSALADAVIERIRDIPGVSNLSHSYEQRNEEISIAVNRQRAADLGVDSAALGETLRTALQGSVISDYIDGDRQIDIRLRLPPSEIQSPDQLANLIVALRDGEAVRLHEIADIKRTASPTDIKRDQQQRIVEISGSAAAGATVSEVMEKIKNKLQDFDFPEGYTLYDAGADNTLQSGQRQGRWLLALAIFLVLVVMAVQYESLKNPLVILLSIPFALTGVSLGLWLADMPLSMSVWLGLIMLAGIVVNNAIVLVEQIEIQRRELPLDDAITTAASLRLRPILMTTLTTVFGMLPLAIGLGEGSEMLQPLAFVIVCGLSFSMLVSLLLAPAFYHLLHRNESQ